jgi:hypothetical protein
MSDSETQGHDKIFRCHSATFHIDGSTYQIGMESNYLHLCQFLYVYFYTIVYEIVSYPSQYIWTRSRFWYSLLLLWQ